MAKGNKLPPKLDVMHALLAQGAAFVHLDPRGVDVEVPDWLKRAPQLVLQFGLNMPVPIRDLRIDDAGVFGTLSFSRAPYTCMVPWHAVFALVGDDGRGMVWPESMPAEIAQEVEREAERAQRATQRAEGAPLEDGKPLQRAARKPSARKARAPLRPLEQAAARAVPVSSAKLDGAPALRVIEGAASAKQGTSAPARTKKASGVPHLRLVKR